MQEFESARIANPVFDDQAQGEIIALAARLQREASQSMSLDELERVAMEAGIEPRFVREAVQIRGGATLSPHREVRTSASSDPAAPAVLWLGGLAFLAIEAVLLYGVMSHGQKGPTAMLAAAVAMLLGAFVTRPQRLQRMLWALPIAAVVVCFVAFAVKGLPGLAWSEMKNVYSLAFGQAILTFLTAKICRNPSVRSREEASRG